MAEEKAVSLDKLARVLNKLRDTGLLLNDWQAGKKYKVNYFVLHENKIYRCKELHTASSTFDETKWEAVSNADSGLKTWGENILYKIGDIVIYGSGIYQCTTEHTSTSTFDTTNWTNLSVGYAKKTLYTSTTYNTASTTVTTTESMLNKDFIIIKIAYSVDGTAVKMNKSYVIAPVVGEVHDFSYQESTTSYIALTGKILNNTTLQFDFTEAQNLTKFKVISIDSLSLGTGAGNAVYSDTPIGTVISYMGNNPPKDYLSCDGTVYNISDYQALADFINTEFGSYDFFGGDGTTTFAVPDLRGEFLRGTGTNSHTNQGDGANVGAHQDGTEFPDIRSYSTSSFADYWVGALLHNGASNVITKADKSLNSNSDGIVYTKQNKNTESSFVNQPTKYTSRPTNTSVLYCIKYTNSNSPEKIDIWTANTSYSVGNIVIYNDKIYRCITANNDATFIPLNWVCLSATGEEDIGHITFGYELQSGYLPLDGSTYNRADYADLINWVDSNSLWASMATDYGKFGTGDGTTTFTTPNFTGKFIECGDGTNTGDYTSAGLPNIKGAISVGTGIVVDNTDHNLLYGAEAFSQEEPSSTAHHTVSGGVSTFSFEGKILNFNASNSSPIYLDTVNTVQPESIKLIPQIKYRKPNKSLPVKAVRRTLFEGSVGSSTNTSTTSTIQLSDSYKNYDALGFYLEVIFNEATRLVYREVPADQFDTLLNKNDSNCNISLVWGYWNTQDYFDFLSQSSTETELHFASSLSLCKKVVGIKYINENQYSTEEQLIGTWIDGKPLYQKTYSVTSPQVNSYDQVADISDLHIASVVDISGCIEHSTGKWLGLFTYHNDNEAVSAYITANFGSLFMHVSDNLKSKPTIITLKYTKTT